MFEAEYIQIGCKVAYYRKMKKYTQKELAIRAKISVSYLSRIERGAYKKGVQQFVLLLFLSLSKLFRHSF